MFTWGSAEPANGAPESTSKALQLLVEQIRLSTAEAQDRCVRLVEAERDDRDKALAALARRVDAQQVAFDQASANQADPELQLSLAQEQQETLSSLTSIHQNVETLREAMQGMHADVAASKASYALLAAKAPLQERRLAALEQDHRDQLQGVHLRLSELQLVALRVDALEGYKAAQEATAAEAEARLAAVRATVAESAQAAEEAEAKVRTLDEQLRRQDLERGIAMEQLSQVAHGASATVQELLKEVSKSTSTLSALQEEVSAAQRALQVEGQQRAAADARLAEDERRGRAQSQREVLAAFAGLARGEPPAELAQAFTDPAKIEAARPDESSKEGESPNRGSFMSTFLGLGGGE